MSNPLADGWGDFLGGFGWDWFVTLTFEGDVKTFTARNRCNAWLKSLEKAAEQPVAWFRGDEYGERFGKFHMHLLIGGVEHLHRFTWMERWHARNGIARIFPFDPSRGAAYYVSKYVTKQFGEWDISENAESFRIRQSNLPLTGQRGSGDNRESPKPGHSAPDKNKRVSTGQQLLIADFKEPDPAEFETDAIRISFREQTRRKR